jgi:phage-related protein
VNEVEVVVTSHDRTRPGFESAEHNAKGSADRIGKAFSGLRTLGMAAVADLASSLAGPLVAAAGAAGAAFAASGTALGVFGVAAIPQIAKIRDLKANLSDMEPATRQAAIAFRGLRSDYMGWSNALASLTMVPVTKGLNILREIMPKLGDLVEISSKHLSHFLDGIMKGVKGGGLDAFIAKIRDAADASLPHLFNSLKNVGVGLAGILSAFLPFAGSMSGGIEKLTAKFAEFGRGLGSNPAFQNWMRDMQGRGPMILGLLGNLAKIILNVAQALAPFTGLTLKVTAALAAFVAAIPQGVMNWLAPTITGIVLAIRAWAVVQGVLNLALAANPIGLVVIALVALAAALVYAYKHSETFRHLVQGAFNAVKEAASSLASRIGPAVEAVRAKLGNILQQVWNLRDKIRPAVHTIATFFTDTLPAAFDTAIGKLLDIVGKVDDAVKQVKDKINGLSSGEGIKGGKKKGGLIDLIAPELAHPEMFIGLIRRTVGKATDFLKQFAGDWRAKLHLDNLGSVRSIASKAKDAALDFAHRAYRALLNASFPGSGVVKGAARAAVGFAKGHYQAVLRALDRASSVGRRVMGYLRSIFHPITVTINAVLGHVPKLPWQATGGISHAAEGGPRGNLTWVGERGPELVNLPFGSTVYPHGQSMGMARGGGMPERIEIPLYLDGREVARAVFEPLKGMIRATAGGPNSVQKALGRTR